MTQMLPTFGTTNLSLSNPINDTFEATQITHTNVFNKSVLNQSAQIHIPVNKRASKQKIDKEPTDKEQKQWSTSIKHSARVSSNHKYSNNKHSNNKHSNNNLATDIASAKDSNLVIQSSKDKAPVTPIVPKPLTDGFSRRLTYLRLSITDFCNFRCGYCLPDGYQGKRPDNELSLAEIATLASAFGKVGTKKIRITGGEPSIRKDVSAIIATLKQTQGIETVAMTSNGYKLGRHIDNWRQAGLDQLNISVDSFEPATFAKMTGFDILPQLLVDMDRLLATTDIKLKLNGILMAETAQSTLLSALNFIKNRPVTYRFIEFMQTSDNSDLFFAQHAQSAIVTQYLLDNGWQAQNRGLNDGPAIEYSHPDYAGRIGMIAPYASHFCDSCNRLRVSSVGKVHLCLFDQGNYDIRQFLTRQDVDGLINKLYEFMPIKPEHHHLADANSGIMHNLSIIGG